MEVVDVTYWASTAYCWQDADDACRDRSLGWYRCDLEAVRQTGEHTHQQGRIKAMGALFPDSPYGLVSWAKVNRRWDPSFQPVGIELPVAKRESQACGSAFEVSNVAFGPRHRLTQQIAGQRLRLRHNVSIAVQ